MTKKYHSFYAKKRTFKSTLVEKAVKYFFFLNGMISVLFLVLIFLFLFREAFSAISNIGINEFFKNVEWYPTSEDSRYSIIPLILGTLLTAIPATIISSFLGIILGIYLSEIASGRTREIIKPFIEIFAGLPTVVIGFLILAVGSTFFQELFNAGTRLNALLAAFGLSIILIPTISSLTEDALRAVPNNLRMASYALGISKFAMIKNVVIPAAISGVSAGIILGFGRAIGETMIVLMASGNAAELTLNLLHSVRTITATIAGELGEVAIGSPHYYSLFFIGTFLLIITFIINLISELIIERMRKKLKKMN
ncbi:MAG: phosphate ABC transporter permease subunit PstC [Melioribacteraceae bacterium]|nr:phosphate ABC transporter permease subunit PstC [Melioribacteraceae bacterium]